MELVDLRAEEQPPALLHPSGVARRAKISCATEDASKRGDLWGCSVLNIALQRADATLLCTRRKRKHTREREPKNRCLLLLGVMSRDSDQVIVESYKLFIKGRAFFSKAFRFELNLCLWHCSNCLEARTRSGRSEAGSLQLRSLCRHGTRGWVPP